MIRAALTILRHPSLWRTAGRQVRRMAAPGWWRRPPFTPRPPDAYLRFRLLTQYGDSDRTPDPHDVLNYLAWCRDWDRRRGP